MRIAVAFPGQGTQQPGMGVPWRDHPAWAVVERAEAALQEPLAPLLLDASADALSRTREAQLAVLLVSLIAWHATQAHVQPVAWAGHSLGQVTALIASGALPFDEGIRFAARRAELTQEAADRHPGRMAALIGADVEQATAACEAAPGACWIANDNAPGQVVIAGTPAALDLTTVRARDLGVRKVVPLAVGGAFHTPLMQDAADALHPVLAAVSFSPTGAPVVSNADGAAHADGDAWRERSAQHVVVPVRWRQTQYTLQQLQPDSLLEVGHGTMLSALAKRTIPTVPVLRVAVPDDITSLVPSNRS